VQIAHVRRGGEAICTTAGPCRAVAWPRGKITGWAAVTFRRAAPAGTVLAIMGGMITSILIFLLLASLLSVLIHADHRANDAAEAARIREGDL